MRILVLAMYNNILDINLFIYCQSIMSGEVDRQTQP